MGNSSDAAKEIKDTREKTHMNIIKAQMMKRLEPSLNWKATVDFKEYVDICIMRVSSNHILV